MKKLSKLLCTALAAVTALLSTGILTASPAPLSIKAYAEDEIPSGTCGNNLTWTLYSNGTLAINGTGNMNNYSGSGNTPWYSERESIKAVTISNGATSIGNYAFSYCSNLTSITVTEGITSIGGYAFYGCNSLTSITIPKSVTKIGDYVFTQSSLKTISYTATKSDFAKISISDNLNTFRAHGGKITCTDGVYVPTSDSVDPNGNYGCEVVYINGKNVKDNNRTTNIDETDYYKSWVFDVWRETMGGKLNVLVTDNTINSEEKFIKLFDQKGKLNATGKANNAAAKKKATATIKDGRVTISAAKETGTVFVWIYEVVTKKPLEYEETYELIYCPEAYDVCVEMAPANLCFANVGDVDTNPESATYGMLLSGKKAVTSVTVPYYNPIEGQKFGGELELVWGDKKASGYIDNICIDITEDEKTANTVSVCYGDDNFLYINALKAGKTSLTLTCYQSGKSAKLNVSVVNYYEVTFPEGVTVSYKSGKDTGTLKSGDFVPDKAKLTITSSSGTINVNGNAIKNGSYNINGGTAKITLEAQASV